MTSGALRAGIAAAACLVLTGCLFGSNGTNGAGRGGAAVEVWAVGDGPNGKPPSQAVAAMIKKSDPRWLIYLGDVYGPYAQRFDETYGRALARRTLPTPGNHEWPSQRAQYLAYWQDVTGRPQPTYYARKVGGWLLISLNSEEETGPGSPQFRWLRSTLADAGSGTCRLAFWHEPRFSAGQHGDSQAMDPLWDALEGHASVVLSGHDHTMQRLAPEQGITQLVSGAGGRSHYRLDTSDPRMRFGDNSHDGALALRLSPGMARFQFVAVGGEVLDTGLVRCDES